MGYTQDEITAVVNKLLLSSVGYGIDLATGNRQVSDTFDDVQESAATLCVMFPTAPLYIATLSVKAVGTGVAAYVTQLTDLLGDVQNLTRAASQITDLSSLAGMQSALLELGGVASAGATSNLAAVPSFQRFTKNAANFLAAVKPAVVSSGDVVPTKQQSVTDIPAQVAALPAAFATLSQNIQYFANGMGDYAALSLPSLLAQNVISRAYQLIATRCISMAALSDYDKQTVLRDATLEVVGTNSILAALASAAPPPLYPAVTGTLKPYADANHALLAPGSVTSLAGPFVLRHGSNDTLVLAVDTPGITLTIPLNAITTTYLDGTVAAPFAVRGAPTPAVLRSAVVGPLMFVSTDTFSLLLECPQNGSYQSWRVDVTVPSGTHTQAAIAVLINAAIVATTGSVLFVADGTAGLSIASAGSGAGQHILVLGGVAATVLGFATGQGTFGTDAANMLYFTYASSSAATPTLFSVTLPTGYQTAPAIVDAINSAIPTALTDKLHATVQPYTAGAVMQQYVRAVLDDTAPTATLTVSGSSDPASAAASVVGLRGTIGHTAQTAQMLSDFLNEYADTQHKFSDVAVASVVGGLLKVASRNGVSVGSQVAVSGNAAATLFGTANLIGYGTTQWCVMSADNPAVAEGDVLELHDSSVTTTSVLSRADDLLYLGAAITLDKFYTFGTTALPYALVRQGGQASYSAVVTNAVLIKFLSDTHAVFFGNLSRQVNMMLADKNPAEAAISTVAALLQSHLSEIQTVWNLLSTFSAPGCSAVDQLFRQLQEKGMDKAVDTLLQCRFSDFFGLDAQSASYAGSVMAGLQTVVQQDLPVAKYDRVKGARQILGTSQSPDYSSDFSDTVPDLQKYTADRV